LQTILDLWHSPEHKKNTLTRNFESIGLGVAFDEKGILKFTEVFADIRGK
jgi:uncharacterized protein YkwD